MFRIRFTVKASIYPNVLDQGPVRVVTNAGVRSPVLRHLTWNLRLMIRQPPGLVSQEEELWIDQRDRFCILSLLLPSGRLLVSNLLIQLLIGLGKQLLGAVNGNESLIGRPLYRALFRRQHTRPSQPNFVGGDILILFLQCRDYGLYLLHLGIQFGNQLSVDGLGNQMIPQK